MDMFRKQLIFFMFIVLMLMFCTSTGAYELTSRSFGMGGAYTGIGEGLEAVLYNPAAIANGGFVGANLTVGIEFENFSELSELRNIEGDFTNQENFYQDIPDNASINSQTFFGARLDSFALSYNRRYKITAQSNSNQAEVKLFNRNEGRLSYAGRIIDPPFDLGALSYGISLNLIDIDSTKYQKENNSDTYTKDRLKGSGYGLDIAIMAKVTDMLQLGYFASDLLVSDIALRGQESEYQYENNYWQLESQRQTSSKYSTTSTSRLGAALQVPVLSLKLAADIDNLFAQGGKGQVVHLGLEKNILFNGFSIRAGKINAEDLDYTTVGLGLNLTGFSLDTAYGFDGGPAENQAFMLAINADF
ncbi:MAG: hypothetical protein ACOCRU_00935 [bacterium]